MRNDLLKYKWTVLGIFLGAAGGFLYYHYIGCASGACIITSKPVNSTLYGALMGGLLANIFHVNQKSPKTKESERDA